MLIATTGIHGEYLKRIRRHLEGHGLGYEAELSSSTRVLVAKRLDGPKYEAAQKRGIPCVTPAWVLMGGSSMKCLTEFEAGKSLVGMEVCGSSLNDVERRGVRDVCDAIRAVYNPTLTQSCILLVLPTSAAPVDQPNEKLLFAKKNHMPVLQYDQFIEQYGIGAALRYVDKPPAAIRSSSGIISYCTPPEHVTDSVKDLLSAAGAILQSSLTMYTTHVIVLAPTTELFIPRAKLEFVSLAWLEQCAALRTRVAADPYRVKVPQRPVIAFTALAQDEKERLRQALEGPEGLPCLVQDEFILGCENDGNRYNTTHLVVRSAEAAVTSQKFTALCWRAYKLRERECLVVEADWVHCSLKERQWIDCTRFTVLLPEFSSLKKMILQKTTLLNTESTSKEKRKKSKRFDTQVEPCKVLEEDEEKQQKGEQGVTSCVGSARSEIKNSQTNVVRSNSLESIIEALESEASMPLPKTPPKPQQEQPYNNNEDSETSYPAAKFSPISFRLRNRPMESQVVVYSRDGTGNKRRPKLVPINGKCNVAVVSSLVTGVAKDGCLIQPQHVCLMIAKALISIQECCSRLQSLGCTLATTIEECTHYVTDKPSRTEYFLSTVAAGKWVLAPSFLEETLREGRIAHEESHEWSPTLARAAHQRQSVVELVQACALQRRRAQRPFASWRVTLCCTSTTRAESFARVLRSGGCEVTESSTPLQLLAIVAADREALQRFTHILSDDDVWSEEHVDALASRIGCIPPVLRLEFVAHCLCAEEPEPERYEIVSSLRSRKRSRGASSG